MGLTYRADQTRPLTVTEIDNNFRYFTGSHAITGSLIVTDSITGSLAGTASYALTASYVQLAQTASIAYTASFVTGSNVSGIVANATTAQTSSYVAGVLNFQSADPLPTVVNGGLILSASGVLYFGKDNQWRALDLVP